jgi:hypothetical protein
MPGYHIRTAAGIVPVKDWYIRTPVAPVGSFTMVAALQGGSRGYENGAATGAGAYGSMTPLMSANLEVRGLVWAFGSTGNPTIVYLAFPGSTPIPPDDDSAFTTITITGVFQDSAGASVVRTLTRSNRDFTSTNATYGVRQWQYDNAKAAQFISGNTYTMEIARATSGGSSIARVKAAYVRTASGIQQFYPTVVPSAITLDNKLAQSFTVGSAATAQYRLTLGGNIETTEGSNALLDTGDWISPKTNMALYSARATLVSGTVSGGSGLGAWLNLAVDRFWTLTSPGVSGQLDGVFTLEIRLDSTGVVQDTASINLRCERSA